MLQCLIKVLMLVSMMTTAYSVRTLASPPHPSPYLSGSNGHYGYYGTVAYSGSYGPSPYALTPAIYGQPYGSPGTTLFGYGRT